MVDMLDVTHPAPTHEPEPEVPQEEVAQEPQSTQLFTGPESLAFTVSHVATPRERSRGYMMLGAIVTVGTAVAWWQASWLTFAVMAVGAAAWELHNRFPGAHEVRIDHKGVTINGHRHDYHHLHSFDMHTMPDGSARLSVKTRRWHLPHLHLPLGEQDPQEVHALLSQYLLEDDHRIPLMDYWMKQ